MHTDSNIRLNLGTINFPTIITVIGGVFAIIGAIYVAIATFSAGVERTDARLDVLEQVVEKIEANRAIRAEENSKRLENINLRIDTNARGISELQSMAKQLEYRMTVNEQAVVSANARMDRFQDVIGELRELLTKVDSQYQLLNQRLELLPALPAPQGRGRLH